MSNTKTIALRFTPEQYARIEQAANDDLLPVNRFCVRAVLGSVLKHEVIPVKRDTKGKFVKLVE